MRLLVTRPIDDAEPLGEQLQSLGHTILLAPVLDIRFLPGVPIPLDGVQAILATSANGIRGLERGTKRRDLPIFAVGPATAQAAREAGFASVEQGGGDAMALAQLVIARLPPAGGPLLHAAGNVVRSAFRTVLEGRGFKVRQAVLYRAEPAGQLDRGAEQALSDGGLDGVLLHSPRSARHFVELVRHARLAEACAELDAFCLSPEVADAIGAIAWRSVLIADRPDQAALLALLPRTTAVAG